MRRAIKKKPKKRSHWGGKRYWKVYMVENGYELMRNGERTINHAIGNNYRLPDESNESFEKFVQKLSHNRDEALQEIREAGIDMWVTGEHRIEVISKDSQYEKEHYRRLGRQLGQKAMAVNRKAPNATVEQQKQFGLPDPSQIKQIKKKLLLGNAEAEVKVK